MTKIGGRAKTQEEWDAQVRELGEEEYVFLERYKTTKVKILCKHLICGNEYLVLPSAFIRGSRCPKCTRKEANAKLKKTHEKFIDNVYKANDNRYEVLDRYTHNKGYNEVRCNECGHRTRARADVLERGRQCSECLKESYAKEYTKTTEQYQKEIEVVTEGEYKLIGEYRGVKEYVTIQHSKCQHKYLVYPYMFKRGRRCPNCNESKGEQLVKQSLEMLGKSYLIQVNSKELEGLKHRYSYDFLIPDQRILIEYQGRQHYEPIEIFGGEEVFKVQVRNDEYKREFAKDNNYHLIEVSYAEDTLEKVFSFLLTDEKLVNNLVSVT